MENDIGDKGAESFVHHLEIPSHGKAPLKVFNLSNNFINEIVAMKLSNILNSVDRPVCHLYLHNNLTKKQNDKRYSSGSSSRFDKIKSKNKKKELNFLKTEINFRRLQNQIEDRKYDQATQLIKENDREIKIRKMEIDTVEKFKQQQYEIQIKKTQEMEERAQQIDKLMEETLQRNRNAKELRDKTDYEIQINSKNNTYKNNTLIFQEANEDLIREIEEIK